VNPEAALDYVLNITGYDYVEDEYAIIVGKKDTLSKDFYNQVTLTKLTLKYITAETISQQIDVLGLPVKKIVIENNSNVIWIQGLPREINKVKDLVSMLDTAENFAEQGGKDSLLTPITLKYISAEQLNNIVDQMGLTKGIVLESNPMTLWIHGDDDLISQIQAIQKNVDIPENSSTEISSITPIKLTYLTTDDIILILNQLDIDVDILNFEKSLKTLWLKGNNEAIEAAKEVIKKFDIKDYSSDMVTFVYNTVNITAQELENRLKELDLNNVKINYLHFPQFSTSIIVQCPSDYKLFLLSQINNLDVKTEKIKLPVDYSEDANGKTFLKNRLNLLVDLTGIPSTSFTISTNVSRDSEKPLYILYLEESPEKIKMVKEYLKYIENPTMD